MKYITGQQALNIPCSISTCGDWHASSMDWSTLTFRESEDSIYKDWGIEGPKTIKYVDGAYYVANDLRAILDFLETGNIGAATRMREDYICTDKYDEELFEQVYKLRTFPFWEEIDTLMRSEYYMKWMEFLQWKSGKQNI